MGRADSRGWERQRASSSILPPSGALSRFASRACPRLSFPISTELQECGADGQSVSLLLFFLTLGHIRSMGCKSAAALVYVRSESGPVGSIPPQDQAIIA